MHTEGTAAEATGRGQKHLSTLVDTRWQKKNYAWHCKWQEAKKDESKDESKVKRPSVLVRRCSFFDWNGINVFYMDYLVTV